MNDKQPAGFNTPFKNLKSRLNKTVPAQLARNKKRVAPQIKQKRLAVDDKTLFLNEMADVTPISRNNIADPPPPSPPVKKTASPSEEHDATARLNRLVNQGEGYIVSATPEYMEGTGYNVHPEISKRLHRGKFSIQAHLDLHGMTVTEAQPAFDNFLKESIHRGLRGVLVIHGRGLSSPGKPILKPKVCEWLTRGAWRKWVIAFSSAKPSDGGAGATYILLRKSPIAKRYRKNKRPVPP